MLVSVCIQSVKTMADTTNEELKNLILSLDSKFEARFVNLDQKIDKVDKRIDNLEKKVEVGFAEIHGEFKAVRREISEVRTELKGEIQQVKAELKGDIQTIEAKLDGFDKRISYQEFASKGVFVTVLGGILLTLARFFFTFDPKKIMAIFNTIGLS